MPNEESSIYHKESSKSERQTHRKSHSSKRNRKAHNHSRLYENAQKLFDYSNPNKNQSIDSKMDKNGGKHIKYTTLLSNDTKLKVVDKSSSTHDHNSVYDHKHSKNASQRSNILDEVQINDSPKTDSIKLKRIKNPKSNDTEDSKQNKNMMDMPKNDEIQKLFSSEVGNSPSQKVIHMSVINSTENFEEDKHNAYHRNVNDQDIFKDDMSDSLPKQSNSSSNKPGSAKAAVPILDFTGLPENDKNMSKSGHNGDSNDNEVKSSSIGSIFDQESHLDLSSKRLKKLILTSDFSSLINLREEALRFKESRERNKISKLLKTAKISPRTGKSKEYELEKWITKEKAEISRTKKIIEDARKKTEDVLKEAHINAEFMKQILNDKVLTPREGMSVRSGMNSSRRQYEQRQREEENKSSRSDKNEEDLINKKIDSLVQKNLEVAPENDNDALVSVDTPQIGSEGNSSFNNTKKIKFDPDMLKESPSHESLEPHIDDNIPINFDIKLNDDPSGDKSSSSEPSHLQINDPSTKSLSRKKSEQHLVDMKPILPENDDNIESVDKSNVTPTPQIKGSITNPFNSDNFFTQNFDEQEMEAAIEQLKNSSGKMGIGENEDSSNKLHDIKDTTKILKKPESPIDESASDKVISTEVPNADDYSLIKQVEKNRSIKTKDSRNVEIKGSKNKEATDPDTTPKVYGDNDVDMLRKNNTNKTDDSRNDKRVQDPVVKSANTSESVPEDIILDDSNHKIDIDSEDRNEDDKNITGEQILDVNIDITPGKSVIQNDLEIESDDRSSGIGGSDSKYATVSILSEMNKKAEIKSKQDDSSLKELDLTNDSIEEKETANKLADLIYNAMLSEIKSELFPQRPLFLLTADLEKIELEQALVYLNDMSVEKEAALLKEYLKYSEDDALNSWDLDRPDKDSDESKMFTDSGKLVLYERKGIATDLFSIEHYVDELATEVDEKCKSKFLTDTFTSIKKDSMNMLNQLQNSDIGSYEHFETDLNSIAILPLEVYLELEKKRNSIENEESKSDRSAKEEGTVKNSKSKSNQKEIKQLKECEHIHNKALFDSINESLLQFKPYGKDGEPMPWSRKQRKLQ